MRRIKQRTYWLRIRSNIWLFNSAPSLHHHYSVFVTTTSWSAPVHCIGTLTLMKRITWISPLTSEQLVPVVPWKSLNKSHATSMPDNVHPELRLTGRLIPTECRAAGFGVSLVAYDSWTVIHFRLSLLLLPAQERVLGFFHNAHDLCSLLNRTRMWWFEASLW